MAKVSFKRGEAKKLFLTVQEEGVAVNLTGAELYFGVKKHKSDATMTIEKQDAAFDKSQVAQGIVSVLLTSTDLNQTPGQYIGELKITFPNLTIDKSVDIGFEIQAAVT